MLDRVDKPWLILDCNNLAWRSYYTTGHLEYHGQPTGTIFGFLRDLRVLQRRFGSDQFVFCFDRGVTLRKRIYPDYKWKRGLKTSFDMKMTLNKRDVDCQIDRIREEILPALGYKNIFSQEGYEADDIIASVAQLIPHEESDHQEGIAVSGDQDLYQLIAVGFHVYHPQLKTLWTYKDFVERWEIRPDLWAKVKALAGCDTDDIPGAGGVGEVTAAKFFAGTLPDGKKKAACEQFIKTMDYARNMLLVRLPLPGVSDFCPKDQPPIKKADWTRVMDSLGIKKLPFDANESLYDAV